MADVVEVCGEGGDAEVVAAQADAAEEGGGVVHLVVVPDGLPYVRFHDLRHGAASLAKAAGASSKEISAQLGHSRQSFTDTTYVTVFPDVAKAAAEAAAALVPRKRLRPEGGAS